MRPMRHGVPAANEGFEDRLDIAYLGCPADSARALGATVRVAARSWRMMAHNSKPNERPAVDAGMALQLVFGHPPPGTTEAECYLRAGIKPAL